MKARTAALQPSPEIQRAGLGILVMIASTLLFSLNDAIGKWLVSTYSVGQVLMIRSFTVLVILAPILWRRGLPPLITLERPGMQLLRALLASAEVYCFFFAVTYLPLADAVTYWLAVPIYVAALSPLLLGEKVGWRRWTAIVVGFIGVVIALRPSAATLTLPALVCIAGSLAFAFMLMSARVLRKTPDTTLVFWQSVAAGIVGLLTSPFGWVTPGAVDLGLLSLLGVLAMLAHLSMSRAVKLADAATVAPFQYTLLLWAIFFGWLFFDDLPGVFILTGAAIIVGAGLFIFFRERRRQPVDSG